MIIMITPNALGIGSCGARVLQSRLAARGALCTLSPCRTQQMDSGSSSEESSLSSLPPESEEDSVLVLRLCPRSFHLPRIYRVVRRTTRVRAQVLLDRPLPLFILFLGSASIGGRVLLHTDVPLWRLLSLCSREARVCIAHFAQLPA